jgi:hypothetical protein
MDIYVNIYIFYGLWGGFLDCDVFLINYKKIFLQNLVATVINFTLYQKLDK